MFFTNYSKLCEKIGKSTTAVGIELGISKTTVSYWRNKSDVIPKQEVLIKIADYFDITVDELLGNDTKKLSKDDKELKEYLEFLKYRPEGKMLFSVAKGCTKEELERAVKIIEALREKDDE